VEAYRPASCMIRCNLENAASFFPTGLFQGDLHERE
jgi:hypothetical protein